MKQHERDAVVARAKHLIETDAIKRGKRESEGDHHKRVYEEALKQIRAEAAAPNEPLTEAEVEAEGH